MKYLILLLFLSCSIDQDLGSITINAAYGFNLKCQRESTYGIAVIDGESIRFDVKDVPGGIVAETFYHPPGKYEVTSITFYNEQGPTYEVKKQGYSEYQVVFIPFKVNVHQGTKLGVQIFCN